jgi:hypothetical protein
MSSAPEHPATATVADPRVDLSTATDTVVLVEGVSDQRAVEALARRAGRDLAAERVAVLAMGGATNIARFLQTFGPHGVNLKVAGLYDQAEERFFARGLARSGFDPMTSLVAHGFFVCVADLEDELIRALGVARIERILQENGDLASFRTFQRQPAQRAKRDDVRLRRFLGTHSGRKIQYAPLLVDALDPADVPRPLHDLLGHL